MILTEWNTEDAIAFAREEGREEGRSDKELEIARMLLTEGSTPVFVQKITGLDMETIQNLKN